jgi:hypothetical protein
MGGVRWRFAVRGVGMAKYTIRESGADGSVEVKPDMIIRRYKKRLGRDHKLEIPMRKVSSVHVDHRIGADAVKVKTDDAEYKWKIAGDGNAKKLADEITYHADS